MLKRGDTVRLQRNVRDIWMIKTDVEKDAERMDDLLAGRWHDDGGEPILYGSYVGWNAVPETMKSITVKVTSLRPQKRGSSTSLYKRRFLAAGWCEELQREVLFQRTKEERSKSPNK